MGANVGKTSASPFCVQVLEESMGSINCMATNADNSLLVTGSDDSKVCGVCLCATRCVQLRIWSLGGGNMAQLNVLVGVVDDFSA
jgi:hypothetical protein